MKKLLFATILLCSLSASAQVDTTKLIQTVSANGYAYKHLQAIYAMLHPTDTFRLKSDWRGIAFKDTMPYFWTGQAWRQFGTGSGSGSTDTSTFIIDTTYNRIAKALGLDTVRLKSIRIRVNSSAVTPTTTDSTLDFNLTVATDPADLSGIRDTLGKKVDTANVVQIDTTSRPNGYIVYWDSTARKYKHKADSVGTGGGSAENDSTFHLSYSYYDEFATAVGDSVLIHSKFLNRWVRVYLNGEFLHLRDSVGYYRNGLSDTIIFKLPSGLPSGYRVDIYATDTIRYQDIALEAPGAPPSSTVAYVASTDGGNNGGSGNTRTFSHTVSSGSDRYLLVGVIGDVTSGANDPVSVTYNGVSMTMIDSMKAVQGGNRYNYVWGLANPDVGAHNVVVTFTSSHYILTGAIEYSGVQGVDVTYKEDVYTNSKTTSTTTTADNAWTVCFATTAGLSQSAGSGSTARTAAATNYWRWFDSGAAITPAGAYSMNTTSYSGSGICHIIISLKPY